MTVVHRDAGAISAVEINCDDDSLCVLSGARISRPVIPKGALGVPGACHLEVGTTQVKFHLVDGILVADEVGGMCATHLSNAIDFKRGTYTFRKFSDLKTGALCEIQRDETTIYKQLNASTTAKLAECKSIDVSPSLWAP